MFEKYYENLIMAVDMMNSQAEGKDLLRNHTNYGRASVFASVLRDMGHEVDIRVYGEGDYLVSAKIIVDGEVKVDYEKIKKRTRRIQKEKVK